MLGGDMSEPEDLNRSGAGGAIDPAWGNEGTPQRESGAGGEKVEAGGDPPVALNGDSVKIMAETIGMIGLPDEAAKELAEEVTYRVRQLAQDAQKLMYHGKRHKMLCEDIDLALRMEGQEPLYGFQTKEHVPFRFASGGGRELHFSDDKELDLTEIMNAQLPKIPQGVSLRSHWLAIDGVQPAIPENPPAMNKDQLVSDSTDPAAKLKLQDARDNKLGTVLGQPSKMKTVETVNVKQLASHELSVEQQLYYKEITEACVGSDEARRAEALQSLACDPGLHQMLPRLCTFIAEGVRVNVVQHNLAILIYLMRMVKSLLENQTLYLEKYLHELIPAVGTCIVSRQLCTRPDVDNHWALRDFASRMMAAICKNFHSSTNNIQTRVTRMFSDALRNERSPLVSYYGAIAGLQELGPEVIKVFILPNIAALSQKIDLAMEGGNLATSSVEKIAAQHIRTLLVKSVSPVLKTLRNPPDSVDEYKQEFGSLGPYLQVQVVRSRQQSGGSSKSSTPSVQPTSVSGAPPARTSTPQPRTPQPSQGQQKVFVVASGAPGTPRSMPMSQSSPLMSHSVGNMIQGSAPPTSATPTLVRTSQAQQGQLVQQNLQLQQQQQQGITLQQQGLQLQQQQQQQQQQQGMGIRSVFGQQNNL